MSDPQNELGRIDPTACEAVLATLGELAQCALSVDGNLGEEPPKREEIARLASRLSTECGAAGLFGHSYLADFLGWGAMRPRRELQASDAESLCLWAVATGEALSSPPPSGSDATVALDALLALPWMPVVPAATAEEVRARLRLDLESLHGYRADLETTISLDRSTEAERLFAETEPSDQGGSDDGGGESWISPDEIALFDEALTEQVLPAAFTLAQASEPEAVAAAAVDYRRQWSRISEALDAMSLGVLRAAATRIDEALARLETNGDAADPELLRTLGEWPIALCNYLQAPGELSRARDLVALLGEPALPTPLVGEAAEQTIRRLTELRIGADPSRAEDRKATALEEDVELEIGTDVLPSVLDGMLQELPLRAAEFNRSVQSLIAEGQPEQIDTARRIAHTLKGDSNIVGVRGIASLTHALEEILIVLADEPGIPVADLGATLLEAADCLEAMSDHLLGRGARPENAVSVLQHVLDWDNALHADPPATAIAAPPLELTPVPVPSSDQPPAQTSTLTEPPTTAQAPATSAAAARPMLAGAVSVPSARLDQFLRTAGEAIIYARQVENRAERVERWLGEVVDNVESLHALVAELQQLVEVRGAAIDAGRLGMGGELDALEMDRFNELHTVTLRLVERIADTRATGTGAITDIAELKNLVVQQDRVHLDLQNQLLETLAVPFASLTPRFARVIRQVSRLEGKDVELVVRGERTLVDSDILQRLAEPIAHILRNAVDHGIEPPGARREAGKPERGTVTLDVSRDADLVTIRCIDDGRGLDYPSIRERAQALGLIGPGDEPAPEQLAPLIFRRGFSTRSEVSQISGRGIGMDVVQASVTRLKGSVAIASEGGQGCEITLRLPVSQILASVLLVEIAAGRQAIALSGVDRALPIPPEILQSSGDTQRVLIDGEWIEAVYLESRFTQAPPASRDADTRLYGLLTRGTTFGRRVVLVDVLGDARRVIVKGLGPHIATPRGVLGATILGDGTVAPVLDLPELVRTEPRIAATLDEEPKATETQRLPTALVVDDSLSMRRSLEHALGEWGFSVALAHDGLEAIERLGEQRPDVLLVDLEMPRMNGLELTSYVRNHPDLRQLPVIMITSRTTQRHRDLAFEAGVDELMTKPFAPSELRVMIERRTATRIDS